MRIGFGPQNGLRTVETQHSQAATPNQVIAQTSRSISSSERARVAVVGPTDDATNLPAGHVPVHSPRAGRRHRQLLGVRVGTGVLDQGPTTSGLRIDPDDDVNQEVVITVRQLEGDPPRVDVDWPSTDFPGLDTWTPREAQLDRRLLA